MKSEGDQAPVSLEAEEAALRARLVAVLPSVARNGAPLFVNSTNSNREIARYRHKDADALFASASRCVELRRSLGLGDAGVAGHFLAACREASSDDPQRRGPRKLAEWLLEKLNP